MNWLQNPWAIGIGTGIISSIAVGVILRLIFFKKDKGEYAQRISTANNEVLYAIRPSISEQVIPSVEVIKRLIYATAKKYSVNSGDMHDLEDITGILMKEVMDSNFLSSETKMKFCDKLVALPVPEKISVDSSFAQQFKFETKYRRLMTMQLTLMTGILTGVITMVIAIKDSNITTGITDIITNEKSLWILLPGILAVALALTTSTLKYFLAPRLTAIYKLPKTEDKNPVGDKSEE